MNLDFGSSIKIKAVCASTLLSGNTTCGITVCGVTVKGTTISGTTTCGVSVKGATVSGTTTCGITVCGVSILGSTCVCSPITCGSTCVVSPKFIENGTCLASIYTPFTMTTDWQDPTGFVDGSNITVSYDWSQRKITLTGTLDYYWNGVKKTLSSPWTSSAHTTSVGTWYLYSVDGTNIVWSQSAWAFNNMQVASVNYKATSGTTFALRETHSLMPWSTHQDLHKNIGTYLYSGGLATSWTANTATNNSNSPNFNAAVIADEDLQSNVGAITKGSYTLMRVSGGTSIYYVGSTLPFSAATNVYIYVNNPTTGAWAPGVNARYYNVYQMLIPTTSDVTSQKFKTIFIQPQATYTSLASAQAEDTRGLALGSLGSESAEFVPYTRITYLTSNVNNNYGRVTIPTNGITYVVGNKMGSTSVSGVVSPSNHANLSNLTWDVSGHLGTNSSLAAFAATGNACNKLESSLMAWTGSTANGVGTYVSTCRVCSNPNMTFDGSSLAVTGNIQASTYVCSPIITGSTIVCSPIVCGTSCVTSPITCGTSCVRTALICSTGQIKGTIISGSTCMASPIICGTSSLISPFLNLCCAWNPDLSQGYIANLTIHDTGNLFIVGCRSEYTVGYQADHYFGIYNSRPNNLGWVIRITPEQTNSNCKNIYMYSDVCITGNTKTKILTGTTCVQSPVLYGSTCSNSPLHCGACVYATTVVCSPIITGSTRVCSPIICATTCFAGSGAGLTGTASNLTANNATCLCGICGCNYVGGSGVAGSNRACGSTFCVYELPMYKSGFWEVTDAAWTPTTDWYWGLTAAHTLNGPAYNYNMQLIANGTGTAAGCNFYLRTIGDGIPTAWRKIITDQMVCAASVGSTVVCRDGNGDFCARCLSICDFIVSSDCRLKTCITPIVGALSTITHLNGVNYQNCDDEKAEKHVGLLAQDVNQVLPEIVSCNIPTESDAKYGITDEKYGIKYDKLTAVLVEAIKELDKKVNCLCHELNYWRNYNTPNTH